MTRQPRLLKIGELLGNRTSGVQSRTGAAPQAHPELPGRLQAHPQLRHLLPGHRQSQDGGHHRRHCPVHPPRGIVTADGTEREADVRRLRHGFHVTDSYTYVDIKGPGGEDLVDRWTREGVSAPSRHHIADMPNLFFLLGPNTALGHNSVVFMIESQIRYAAQAIAAVDRAGAQALAPNARRGGLLQRGIAGRIGGHGVEHRRLPELVSRRAWGEPDAVERDDVAVLDGHPQVQGIGVQILRPGTRHANTRCRGYNCCRTPGVVSG